MDVSNPRRREGGELEQKERKGGESKETSGSPFDENSWVLGGDKFTLMKIGKGESLS